MTSLYKQSVPVLIKYLNNLSGLLKLGEEYADKMGMKHDYMLNYRLYHNMRPLTYQVQACSNTVKFFASRLEILEDKYFPDDESTFDQLQERITATIAMLNEMDEQRTNEAQSKPVIMKTARTTFKFESGQTYFAEFGLANFHFHFSTAYCLLRALGVPIDAINYLGEDTFVKVDE